MTSRKICVDRLLPRDIARPHMLAAIGGTFRAISPVGKNWLNGSVITVSFVGGSEAQREMVRDIAPRWTDYANLDFQFTDAGKVRVAFDPANGAWSYVGLDNLSIPETLPTMNLGWQDQAVILHEFGHMIGLYHEHQNPDGGIEWNEEAVIRDLSGPPNNWTEAQIRHNVLDKYSADQLNGTEFDERSIMIYAFPDDWTLNTGSILPTTDLSETDRAFIASAKMYPPVVEAVELPVQERRSLDAPGEEDLFQFTASEDGNYSVQTHGQIDTVMGLFGPDDPTTLVAEDDDGGQWRNARVRAWLPAGKYLVRLSHYRPTGTGDYEISVTRGS